MRIRIGGGKNSVLFGSLFSRICRWILQYDQLHPKEASRGKQPKADGNVKKPEIEFLLDLQTLIGKTASSTEIIKKICLEQDLLNQLPENYEGLAETLAER